MNSNLILDVPYTKSVQIADGSVVDFLLFIVRQFAELGVPVI